MSTDSELREAAETALSHLGDGLPDCWLPIVETLAKGVLAQRADDGELVTEEWCRWLLGKRNTGRLYSNGRWIPEIRGIDQWVRLPQSITRGQLRHILSALGVNTGDGAG